MARQAQCAGHLRQGLRVLDAGHSVAQEEGPSSSTCGMGTDATTLLRSSSGRQSEEFALHIAKLPTWSLNTGALGQAYWSSDAQTCSRN